MNYLFANLVAVWLYGNYHWIDWKLLVDIVLSTHKELKVHLQG